jgi:hypothetical protein
MKKCCVVLGWLVMMGGLASVRAQASLTDLLPRVEEALIRADAGTLQSFGVNAYAFGSDLFEGVTAVRLDGVESFGVQRYVVKSVGTEVFELEAIFARKGRGGDTFGLTQPWRLINLRELTETHDDYLDIIRSLHPNLQGRGLALPASEHEDRFTALADLVHEGSPTTRAFLERNSVNSLQWYDLEPTGETLFILRGLKALFPDGSATDFDIVFEKHPPVDLGLPSGNWYITYTTLVNASSRTLYDKIAIRVQELTGVGEEDASALLFDMVQLFEDLELHLNLIANPARAPEERLRTMRATLARFFESGESVVQVSSKKYGIVLTRSVDRYLRRLARLDELFGYRRVRFDFEKGVAFQDIQRIAGRPDTYDAVFVLWQIFESENEDGRVYQDATKKRFRAFIRRGDDQQWEIKLTQVLVDDTQTLEAYMRYIRPSLIKETVHGGI